jgi:3-oxoacyl-[acyl-carrier-protein] synthase III
MLLRDFSRRPTVTFIRDSRFAIHRADILDNRSPDIKIGIVSAGYFIPDGVITSAEMARESRIPLDLLTEKFGIDRKHIAPADEHPTSMGLKAAQNALITGNTEPGEIDLIAYCGSGYYDYQFWSPAASIQHTLGARNAFAFDIKNACNGGNLGVRVASMLLAGDPSKRTALIICSDKLSPVLDYRNKDNLPFFALADGASAAVLQKDEPSNTLLSYAGITDGTLDDYVRVSFGGTKTMSNSGHPHDERHFSVDPTKALADILPEVFLGNFIEVIRRAVAQSGYKPGQVRWLLTNQIKKTRVLDILHALGLNEDNTRFTMRDYGSIGPGDTLFSLALQLEEDRIKPGDLVVLASSGIGFSWGAQVIRYTD